MHVARLYLCLERIKKGGAKIQPEFKPASSECRSDATTEPLELCHCCSTPPPHHLVSSPDLIQCVYRFQYNAILKPIHTGVGFRSGTETTPTQLDVSNHIACIGACLLVIDLGTMYILCI